VKRSLLVEAEGGPLAAVVAGANVHDTKLLAQTLEAVVVERPNRLRNRRSICAWIRATTIRQASRP
jgi:putative transposase